MIIYVDIDNTICNTENEIVYWTARGGHSGLNWKAFTEYQLTNWECKYTRIETQKKPSYDLFICDKTKRIEEI